jgi:hypothetical protein
MCATRRLVALYCDASVQQLNPKIDLKVMKGLCTIRGGEDADGDP